MPGYEVIGNEELAQIKEIFDSGGILFRHGFDDQRRGCYKVKEFENEFCSFFKAKHSLAVTSGTAALRVALAALGIGSGDEVITQTFTFVATAEAIIEANATPVFAEINNTLNIDPELIESKITQKTKAIIVVHMLGVPCEIDKIKRICKKYNLFLIEDTAWGCGGRFGDEYLGTIGDIGTFSFDFAKTITTGEGGMLLIKEKSIFNLASAWHDHGHENNPLFPRWEDTRSSSGFNYRMMELQGAVGLAQLKKLNSIIELQRKNKDALWENISDLEFIEPREIPKDSYETADALIFFVPNKIFALECRKNLIQNGIGTKILPEAYTWHFAGSWSHLDKVTNQNLCTENFTKSHNLLSKAVSIPINTKINKEMPKLLRESLIKTFQEYKK